jgi:predicted type IV restriction endonuclease
MNEKLSALFNRIKSDSNLLTVSEAQTSQGIVLPILNNLGWDVFNTTEVTPEFTVANKRVDFALRIQSINKVFLEIKKVSENLDNHQEQLVYYAFQQGVKLAILTNGVTWQFYLPLEEGNWEQRRFFTIDLDEQSIEDAIEKFETLLLRKNIETGSSYNSAKSLYEGRQKNKIIKENLPKAWQKLISEPDEALVDLLNETLEKICGYKAENNQITHFLQNNFPHFSVGTLPAKKGALSKHKVELHKTETPDEQNLIVLNLENIDSLFFTKILEARFNNEGLPTSGWRAILDKGLQIAFKEGVSLEIIQNELSINIKEGIYTEQGFSPIEGLDLSWQNQDANKTATNAIKLAALLNCEIYVLFEWREKGKYPMKKGLINWKP